jgi:hypothetical protein
MRVKSHGANGLCSGLALRYASLSFGADTLPLKFKKKWDISRPQQNVVLMLIEAIILSLLSAVLSEFSMRGPSRSCFPLLLQSERLLLLK